MLITIDKDGTLVEPASGDRFVQHPTDQRLLPGVAERIAELKAMGATIVVCSNQGGVGAGHKLPSQEEAEMLYLKSLLPEIDLILSCPDLKGRVLYERRFYSFSHEASIENINNGCHSRIYYREDHDCLLPGTDGIFDSFRKPGCGMLQWAMQEFDSRDTLYIGDRPEDQGAAAAAGIPFVDAEAWRSGQVVITPGAVIA